MSIIPTVRSPVLCSSVVQYRDGQIDLRNLFTMLRPRDGYPYTPPRFQFVAQLVGGSGDVSNVVEVRNADTDDLIWQSKTLVVRFMDRLTIYRVSVEIANIVFDRPGLYIISLTCDNQWVCDTTLRLLNPPRQ